MFKNTDSIPGTLKHLRNVMNRSAVGSDPSKNMNAAEGLVEDILAVYVIRMALIKLGLTVEEGYKEEDTTDVDVMQLAREVVQQLTYHPGKQTEDKVLQHTQELCTLCFVWYHYRDIIREGDGARFQRLVPLLLHVMKNTGRKNYTKELVLLIFQLQYTMSERMKMEVLYSRTVNQHGRKGKNIACDLTMEHHNRYSE
jgi:hypothetical protein